MVHKEPSAILILLHRAGEDGSLKSIAEEYDRRFGQESVLMTDLPAKTSFVTAPTTRP